ncbi:MAG TPA: diacylglycerol kinase family protein [Hyphomicrobiaceae bacterium]|nr:diacylglycerol kinase family protein [Hyphomicrobiaceae bacterium]
MPLGVVPLGTLNHFAKDLGIPMELDAAAAVNSRGSDAPHRSGRGQWRGVYQQFLQSESIRTGFSTASGGAALTDSGAGLSGVFWCRRRSFAVSGLHSSPTSPHGNYRLQSPLGAGG